MNLQSLNISLCCALASPANHALSYHIICLFKLSEKQAMFSKQWSESITMKLFGSNNGVMAANIVSYNESCRRVQLWYGLTLTPTAVQKLARLGTNGPPGASITLLHHLSDPCGGYSMTWRHLIIWSHYCQCHQFWLRFADKVPSIQPHAVQKLARLGTNGPPGASITLLHHLSDSCGGYSMIIILSHYCRCHQLWLRFGDRVVNIHPTAVHKMARLGTNGPPGASITLLHHLSDPHDDQAHNQINEA
jgi:hypothetical protein